MILYFLTLEFSRYYCKHWHCDLTLSKTGIQALFLWTLQLWPYPFFHWNSIFLNNIGILTSSFLTLEFCLCFIKHWHSDVILPNIGILSLLFKLWNSNFILPYTGNLPQFFWTLQFWSYPSLHSNSTPILLNIEILPLFY